MTRNPPFYSFSLFLTISIIFFINKPDYLRDLTVLLTSYISSFEIINVPIPEPKKNLFWIAAFVADPAYVNPSGIKTLLADGLSTFLIKDKPNGWRGPTRHFPNYTVSDNWIFDNLILTYESFTKSLTNFWNWYISS